MRFFPLQGVGVPVRNGEPVELQEQRAASGFIYSNGPNTVRGKGSELFIEIGRLARKPAGGMGLVGIRAHRGDRPAGEADALPPHRRGGALYRRAAGELRYLSAALARPPQQGDLRRAVCRRPRLHGAAGGGRVRLSMRGRRDGP